MPVLCIGPVCIPLNLLLPFLLGVAHHYGWLKWVKREWVTLQHWRRQVFGAPKPATAADTAGATCAAPGTPSGSQQQRYVCEGGVCRMVPIDSAAAAAADEAATAVAGTTGVAGAAGVHSSNQTSQAAAASSVRQRTSSNMQGMRAVDL